MHTKPHCILFILRTAIRHTIVVGLWLGFSNMKKHVYSILAKIYKRKKERK